MSDDVREKALRVLREPERHSPRVVFKALFDLYHNPERGDESLLYPLLDHGDDMVVAWTLYALANVYGQWPRIRPLVLKMALGDPRDRDEKPIQCMALEELAAVAHADPEALATIWRVAEDPTMSDCPREAAWSCLARIYGVEWTPQDMETLIEDPDGPASEAIRERIRAAIGKRVREN